MEVLFFDFFFRGGDACIWDGGRVVEHGGTSCGGAFVFGIIKFDLLKSSL